MYFAENNAQPEKFPNIPATLWWAVATLTTVGYGDVYPITILGKLLGSIISIMGIGLIAMPSGIISMGLIKEVEKERKGKKRKEEICL
jgi:voltage-gated potassium channel